MDAIPEIEPTLSFLARNMMHVGSLVRIVEGKEAGEVGEIAGVPSQGYVNVGLGDRWARDGSFRLVKTTATNIRPARPDQLSKSERERAILEATIATASQLADEFRKRWQLVHSERLDSERAAEAYRKLGQYESARIAVLDALRETASGEIVSGIMHDMTAIIEKSQKKLAALTPSEYKLTDS